MTPLGSQGSSKGDVLGRFWGSKCRQVFGSLGILTHLSISYISIFFLQTSSPSQGSPVELPAERTKTRPPVVVLASHGAALECKVGVLQWRTIYLKKIPTHRIHVWYIYLHEWLIFMVNVGKYTIHGCYGVFQTPPEVRCFLGCPNASSQGVWKPVGEKNYVKLTLARYGVPSGFDTPLLFIYIYTPKTDVFVDTPNPTSQLGCFFWVDKTGCFVPFL